MIFVVPVFFEFRTSTYQCNFVEVTNENSHYSQSGNPSEKFVTHRQDVALM